MITMSEFKKADYWLIKWPLLSLLLGLCLVSGLYLGLNSLDTAAAAELRQARNELNEVRDSVAKIEEEESTIIEYIGRYEQLAEDGVVAEEDRLEFQETMAELRTEFSLFPVTLSFAVQTALPLEYSDDVDDPGRPIILHSSLVDISMPLLHEDDLSRLLSALLARPGLLQPLTCSLSANRRPTAGYIYLSQHFEAACSLQWYTLLLPPEAGRNQPND